MPARNVSTLSTLLNRMICNTQWNNKHHFLLSIVGGLCCFHDSQRHQICRISQGTEQLSKVAVSTKESL